MWDINFYSNIINFLKKSKYILSFAVFIAGLCSIIYELLISTVASYFLGDSIKQFTLLIGIYLFSMGVGAFFSRYLKNKPLDFFIRIEIILGLVGGVSVPIIYFLFITVSPTAVQFYCFFLMFLIGFLTGTEVPLLTFASENGGIKNVLSNVLSLDYIGGLIATLLFPFLLLPFIGLFYSSLLFGLINISLGLWVNSRLIKKYNLAFYLGSFFFVILMGGMFFGNKLLNIWDEQIYNSPIIVSKQSNYQKIVITKRNDNIRLFLNRQLQFSSKDEYRYHESLAHIPCAFHSNPKNILVLGGGENLITRELLKHNKIQHIDVVDIDPEIFHLALNNHYLVSLNESAASDERVNLIVEDAFTYLKYANKQYDIIIADLPDPSNDVLAKLYSKQFFGLAKKCLNEQGVFITQSCDIYHSNLTFNCIRNTLNVVFENTKSFNVLIPSFGNWGFNMSSDSQLEIPSTNLVPEGLKFLDEIQLKNAFIFPKDIAFVKTKINHIDRPIILDYFLDEWIHWKENIIPN